MEGNFNGLSDPADVLAAATVEQARAAGVNVDGNNPPTEEPIIETQIVTDPLVVDTITDPIITNTPSLEPTPVNWEEISKGTIKSYEDLEALTNRAKLAEQYEQDLSNIQSPWVNDDVKQLDAFIRTTGIKNIPEAAGLLQRVIAFDPETTDGLEAKVLSEIIKNPSLLRYEERLRTQLEEQYGLTEDSDPLERDFTLTRLKSDAIDLVSKIADIKASIAKANEPYQAPARANQDALVQSWQPAIENLGKQISKFEVPFLKADGKVEKGFTLDISQEQVAEMMQVALNAVRMQNVPLNNETVVQVQNMVQSQIAAQNVAKIASMADKLGYERAKRELDATYNNPSGLQTKQPDGQQATETPQEFTARQLGLS
jgi:hypothetical protein